MAVKGKAIHTVLCRGVTPKALRTVAACKKCQWYGGMDEIRPAGQMKTEENPDGLPPSFVVICGLPTKEMVIDIILED